MSKNIYVTFKSDRFNTSESKDYFINPNCFGDDVGKWLMQELEARGVSHEEDGPDQEDFGWYVNFSSGSEDVTCLIIYAEDEGLWKLVLERNAGLIGSLFGQRNKKVSSKAVEILEDIIKSDAKIEEAEWHNL